jgi:hypothetical protein
MLSVVMVSNCGVLLGIVFLFLLNRDVQTIRDITGA